MDRDVIKELAATGDQLGQAATRGEILVVQVQVVGQVQNSLGEQGDLVRRASGVSFVELICFGIDGGGAHGRKGWAQLRLPGRPRWRVRREVTLRNQREARKFE